jgi:hypothetical protein
MSTGNALQPDAINLLARMHSKSIERFDLELGELRTAIMAMANCCEQSLTRLQEARWISLDDASRMVAECYEAAESERTRAAHLAADLEAAKHELDEVRAVCRMEVETANREIDEVRTQCEVEIAIAREAASRHRDERVAAYTRELNAARERAAAAIDAEAKLRERLAAMEARNQAMEARNQEIVDAQMLQLVELKRELQRTSTDADRTRATAETANRDATAKPGERAVSEQPGAIEPQPRPMEAKRNHLTPEFEAIDAVLAGSPPVPAWERTA